MSDEKKLQIWWVPQVPMRAFNHPVPDVKTGALMLRALADYDIFQFENNIKPDYSNAGGLQMWDEDSQEFVDWYDEETGEDDPEVWLSNQESGDENG